MNHTKSNRKLVADPPRGKHGYGDRMIELSHNLARRVGFRATANILRIFFDWLEVKIKTPRKDAIRNLSKRLGIALMQKPMAEGEAHEFGVNYRLDVSGCVVARKLKSGRLPASTEILESLFGRFKQMERQHSKSGFTNLVACIPTLLKPTTAEEISECFSRVSANDVKDWIRRNYKTTLSSRRRDTFKQYRSATALAAVT